jgi:hypothetical protein
MFEVWKRFFHGRMETIWDTLESIIIIQYMLYFFFTSVFWHKFYGYLTIISVRRYDCEYVIIVFGRKFDD